MPEVKTDIFSDLAIVRPPLYDHKISVETDPLLPVELVARAEIELQEKPQWRQRDIEALRQILKEETNLRCRMDNHFLLRFLRARKFDYDRAAQLVQHYYLIRKHNPSLFTKLWPSRVKHVFEQQMQTILPDRDPEGRQVFVFRAGEWDPSHCSVDDIFRANVMCLEHCISSVETQVCGLVALVDMANFSFYHARNFTAQDAKRVISVIQESFPVRFAGFHFVNQPWVFNIVYNLVRPFLSEKLKSRMYFHGSNMRSLHVHLPPSILPEEYGGLLPSFDNTSFYQDLCQSEDYFKEIATFGYDSGDVDIRPQDLTDDDGMLLGYYKYCAYKPW